MYFLLKPISWKPNAGQKASLQPVTVPKGFVTDFASIPRPFWVLLPPDGEYTYAAIIHDYLYWDQSRSRAEADEIFNLAMQDFRVGSSTAAIVHAAVRVAGQGPWNENAKLKTQGERRVLKKFPEDPRTRWIEWKRRDDVFA